jgi:hypothetical protein
LLFAFVEYALSPWGMEDADEGHEGHEGHEGYEGHDPCGF